MSKKERNIRRGIFLAVIAIVTTLICGSIAKTPQKELTAIPYCVQAGETLWSIAAEYKPSDMRYDDYIRKVQEHNGIGSDIKWGDEIEIFVWEEN